MNNKIIKYILVGLVNTIFGYSVFALLLYLHLHYSLATLLASIAGVLLNFKTIGGLVFKSHNNSMITKFVVVYVVTYLLNVGSLKIFNSYNVNMYLAGVLLLILITPISFILHNKFVFTEKMVTCL